jgi:hypothetical protein
MIGPLRCLTDMCPLLGALPKSVTLPSAVTTQSVVETRSPDGYAAVGSGVASTESAREITTQRNWRCSGRVVPTL